MPLRGEALPSSWRRIGSAAVEVQRVGVSDALTTAGLPASLTERLPDGYVVASAELSTVGTAIGGVTLYLRQKDMDAAGEPLTLHVERDTGLPPPSSAAQSRIRFAGVEGRWTPSRSQLEWVDRGTYHALQGKLGLGALLEIASAVARVST